MKITFYIAGPDVFYPDAVRLLQAKKNAIRNLGHIALIPIDNDIGDPDPDRFREFAFRIAAANEAMIRRCDGVIANLTPFRGPHADPGTAYEVGFARALGKPVFGYTMQPGYMKDRIFTTRRGERSDEDLRDDTGHLIEDFGLRENLMLEKAVHDTTGDIICADGVSNAWTGREPGLPERYRKDIVKEGSPFMKTLNQAIATILGKQIVYAP